MIRFDRQVCADLQHSRQREWLETNGLGGFAAATITGMHTRRYHGLLFAATRPPVGRLLLLAKLEERLLIGDREYELSVNQYAGAIHPRGFQYLKEFRLQPFPVFVYEVEGRELVKSVFMLAGENSTVIQYELRAAAGAWKEVVDDEADDWRLEVRPLLACRDYHATMRENTEFNPHFAAAPQLLRFQPYASSPALYLAHDATTVEATGYWYRNFELQEERERGLDFLEDLFQPLALTFALTTTTPRANLIASTEARDIRRVETYRQQELARREQLAQQMTQQMTTLDVPMRFAEEVGEDREAQELVRQLRQAAAQFIVARGRLKTVIAGYPWFGDWGRDTMIALPGLLYVKDGAAIGSSILLEFARHTSEGMLPNRFPDEGEAPEYNTIDATLWFFEAIRSWAARTGDYEFVRENLYATLVDIVDWHLRGTRYAIKVDADGLLAGGVAGAQLTWMDAKVGDYVVTPRHGKPVEIQALWYNALCIMQDFAERLGDAARQPQYAAMAARAKQSFNEQFWCEEGGYLYDVIGDNRAIAGSAGEARDASLRPNQIFAVRLPHTMLTPERARRVVEVVERELLTPYGLRSLARHDPQYRTIYKGDAYARDTAYHQGTVWAWLMGAFITAYVKVNQRSAASRRAAAQLLKGFAEHLSEAGLGQVSEIFDADPPHTPRGCIAQAWSVTELLRAACEDVYAEPKTPVEQKNVA